MTTSANASGTASPQPAPSVVSVNARGGRSRNDVVRGFGTVLLLASILVIGLYLFNLYRNHQAEKEREKVAAASAENKAALVGRRRIFNSDPDALPPPPPPPKNPVVEAPPPPPIPVVRGPLPHSGPTAQKGSRYGGQVLVPDKAGLGPGVTASNAGAPGTDPNEIYRRILESHGVSPPPGSPAARSAMPRMSAPPTTTTNSNDKSSASIAAGSLQTIQYNPNQWGGDRQGNWPSVPTPMTPQDPDASLPSQRGRLDELLRPGSEKPKAKARMLGNLALTLPRGRTIDCSLATRVISEVSGMAECTVASDVYGADQSTVLIDRGSQASGEYVAAMAMGQRRLFLVWNRILTPSGVVIDLESPAADALGASGLPGYIDNRWVDRIGMAVMLSVVQDAIAYAAAHDSGRAGGGYESRAWTFQNTRQTGDRMVNTILQQTIAIKPTLYANQGDRASIYIARDLDFNDVYALQRE